MRINLWAGAGAGKSTIASGCFYDLKCMGYNVELVREYIKAWAYENKKPKSFDQIYVFAKQLRAEDHLLQHGISHIVTDSPIKMQVFYARRYNFPCWEQLYEIADRFEELYPAINVFLSREGLEYKDDGRYEREAEARKVDREILDYMDRFVGDYKIFPSVNLTAITNHVIEQINR
ncbi:MAG: hypothetical protein DWQ19_09710 [Crenarchaeota archaeon]|nr:MAG: hypothetical protein DWQ19_09710 [Thermoproteota archaeon]